MRIERVSDKGKSIMQRTVRPRDFLRRSNSERLTLNPKRDFLKGGGKNQAQEYIQQFDQDVKDAIVNALVTEGRYVSDPTIRPILKEYARLLKIPEAGTSSQHEAEISSQHEGEISTEEKARIEGKVTELLSYPGYHRMPHLYSYLKNANVNTAKKATIGLDYLGTIPHNGQDLTPPYYVPRYDNVKKALEKIIDET